MTREIDILQEIIGKAVSDEKFRQTLLKDPASATKSYNLSPEDMSKLKSLTEEVLGQFSTSLDARISKSTVTGAITGDMSGAAMDMPVPGGEMPVDGMNPPPTDPFAMPPGGEQPMQPMPTGTFDAAPPPGYDPNLPPPPPPVGFDQTTMPPPGGEFNPEFKPTYDPGIMPPPPGGEFAPGTMPPPPPGWDPSMGPPPGYQPGMMPPPPPGWDPSMGPPPGGEFNPEFKPPYDPSMGPLPEFDPNMPPPGGDPGLQPGLPADQGGAPPPPADPVPSDGGDSSGSGGV
ncbi:MAG: Os1348 family NHLP clan protein [Solirubrobacterales bacterium]